MIGYIQKSPEYYITNLLIGRRLPGEAYTSLAGGYVAEWQDRRISEYAVPGM